MPSLTQVNPFNGFKLAVIPALCGLVLACQSQTQKSSVPQLPEQTLFSFESQQIPMTVDFVNAKGRLVQQSATKGKQALQVNFDSSNHEYSAVNFKPQQAWDWSNYDSFSIAFDIANHGQYSTQLFLNVYDIDGQVYTRSVTVPVGDSKTYYSKMAGHDLGSPSESDDEKVELNLSSGLRSNPATWDSDDVQFIWMWGTKNLNIKGIKEISLSVQYNLHDKEITLDNVRVMANPKMDPDYLKHIVDKFGQPTRLEYEEKIHSLDELHAARDAELARLNGGEKLGDRSKYSGWRNGPKLEATGYFRTEKIGDKWTLVDPEGYLYFTTGIDNVRMSNATTLTGYDYDQSAINQRTAGEVTPEDSQGLNPPPARAHSTRHLVSETRANMFEWLPADHNDPLANNFGYRRAAHSGPLERGEVFSFYMANLERKYGETTPYSYLKDWSKVTVDRMLSWGFTSFGNWIDPMFYDNQRIPYFANGWIIGDFKTVSSGNDFWGGLPDVFDPKFAERAEVTIKKIAEEVQNSPWCVGVFIDNEKSWGRPETKTSELGIVIHTLTRNGDESPTKNMFTQKMREKYQTITQLNTAWNTQIKDWAQFHKGEFNSKIDANNAQQVADYEQLLYSYAHEYFRIVDQTLEKHLPNHMYMGVRFADWGMPMPVVKASAEFVDVVSFNLYKEGVTPKKWAFLEDLDMPTIIGEFHMGTTASGFFHPGLIHAANQEDRARMYQDYMKSVIDNNYFIGAHWFQYLDSPITGRAYDGENYNVGFVSVTDIPYNAMVDAARELHGNLYERRFKDVPEVKELILKQQ
ncbi:beta-galactosidase [Gayadomonas joobiniege]|uniref:beta-galactosidase n=1 Tax=Gayadomonas joobiniege TaxID=1234606 RepID=UPI00036A795A|nr:beta-galactosidase [Gayadomonas joobiniege]